MKESIDRILKNEDQWLTELGSEAFRICRQGGMEPPFSNHEHGLVACGSYSCRCCQGPLFDAKDQLDSGLGWPTFERPIKINAIVARKDLRHGVVRTQIICARCDSQLGFAFDANLGIGRCFCINSTALVFSK